MVYALLVVLRVIQRRQTDTSITSGLLFKGFKNSRAAWPLNLDCTNEVKTASAWRVILHPLYVYRTSDISHQGKMYQQHLHYKQFSLPQLQREPDFWGTLPRKTKASAVWTYAPKLRMFMEWWQKHVMKGGSLDRCYNGVGKKSAFWEKVALVGWVSPTLDLNRVKHCSFSIFNTYLMILAFKAWLWFIPACS